jgi:hypothetical protein
MPPSFGGTSRCASTRNPYRSSSAVVEERSRRFANLGLAVAGNLGGFLLVTLARSVQALAAARP